MIGGARRAGEIARLAVVRRVLSRLLTIIATLLVISVVVFVATNLTGTDAATAALGRFATDEQIAAYEDQQGLNEPLLERYWTWLSNVVTGDWGDSIINRKPVEALVAERAKRTFILSLVALGLAVTVSVVLGTFAAMRGGGKLDATISTGSLVFSTIPEFVIALALLYIVSVWLGLLPPNSIAVSTGSGWAEVKAYILPALSLAIVMTPYLIRMIRASVKEVLVQPYIQAARLRGMRSWRLLAKHVLPNALGPVVNVIALTLAEILVGAVIVENVFGFPGLGQLAVSALESQDVPLIQATVLIGATAFVVLNLVADIAVTLLNPRLRRRQVIA